MVEGFILMFTFTTPAGVAEVPPVVRIFLLLRFGVIQEVYG